MENFPMRINKYLSHRGIATRIKADELIKRGLVTINGKKAVLGDKVLEKDIVKVNNKTKENFIYLAYNKPKGVVTANPQGNEIDIAKILPNENKVFPIGRLDKNSYGLIILSNDGRVTDRLLNPEKNHEKEYIVEVDRKYTPAFLEHMKNGVMIGDYKTKPAIVKRINDKKFSIILTEGKNRQIRRMTEKLGYTVKDLCRIRIQNIKLGDIKQNSYRKIEGEEKDKFLQSLNLQ